MYALAINGSPRKTWNTATMLEHALQGAQAGGAETEIVHLRDMDYKGCVSCFECKRIGGASYGRCAVQDTLAPVLEKAWHADVLVLGTPVYCGTESGIMRCFLERFMFPLISYTPEPEPIAPHPVQIGLIYTMNVTEEQMDAMNRRWPLENTRGTLTRIFGNCALELSTDTYQFRDYSKYLCTKFDGDAKARRREEVFPQDCARARDMGAHLAEAAARVK